MINSLYSAFNAKVEDLIANAQEKDIIVLKGFPFEFIRSLRDNDRLFLDGSAINEDGRVNMKNEKFSNLFMSLLSTTHQSISFMVYESLLTLYSNLQNLDATGKRFVILENNLLNKYINPSNAIIPDFESEEFENLDDNEIYSNYYSNCSIEDGRQMIEYVELPQNIDCITRIRFIEPALNQSIFPSCPSELKNIPAISTDGMSIDTLLSQLFYNGYLESKDFLVEQGASNNAKLGLLLALAEICGEHIHLYEKSECVDLSVRLELQETLKKIWGFDTFRDLQIYKDLVRDRSVMSVSQGQVIENVVQQAEYALGERNGNMSNVLLTAPTGAGKSLLFQLAGIYLADKYDALTIVVSPLVALMEDQVAHLKTRYEGVAALNGNRTPQEKQDIIQGIQDGRINILYIAPELLLSYSLPTFTGLRKIGLLVVDEAHTVTTWGRDFRVDYWFLGSYLKSSMKHMGIKFPIFALTATAVWDPSGRNDMVFETISSLNMAPCNKYIGVVRRDDIAFDINNPVIATNYHQERINLTAKFVRDTIYKGEKAIVYFPYKRDIDRFVDNANLRDVADKISKYHADLTSLERNMNAQDFKNGKCMVMLATKAFGMGIDVSDIKTVYHHAPSGSLSDYTQEIGRAARMNEMQGIAKIDFTEKDLRFTKMLFGLSSIKPYQVHGVLNKLMSLYRLKGNKRNMVVAPEDFEHLFPGDNVDIDQKVKSTLLLISNDLLRRHNYNVLIVRPKNMFSKSYISVTDDILDSFKQKYSAFIKTDETTPNIFLLDCEQLWNQHFSNITFSRFKYQLGTGTLEPTLMPELNKVTIVNKLNMVLNGTKDQTVVELEKFFRTAETILDWMAKQHKRYELAEIRNTVLNGISREQQEMFLETFNFIYCTGNNPYCKFYHNTAGGEATHLQLTGDGYNAVRARFLSQFSQKIRGVETSLYAQPGDDIFELAQILDSLDLATYERIGGEKPSIFVRVNNPFFLNTLAKNPNYENLMLKSVYDKFECSKQLFTHFFTHKMNNKTRWNFIEDYFLGTPVERLLEYGK